MSHPADSHPLSNEEISRLWILSAAIACIATSAVISWLRPAEAVLAETIAMSGALLAALPAVWGLVASIRLPGFAATRYYMDQYVVIALAACIATERYVSGALVAIILVAGQMLEERTTLGVDAALKRLRKISRLRARRSNASHDDALIDADTLATGDEITIRPGEFIPADAVILEGTALIDQSAITGESIPIEAGPGSHVFAGTLNLNGALTAKVSGTGDQTVLGRVKDLIEQAKTSTSPLISLTEDYARYYTPLILLISLCVFLFTRELDRAIAVLVVSIPCAFVLASPAAMVAAISSASRLGILIRSVRHFEAARRIDTIIFDKTGTLTTGKLELQQLVIHQKSFPETALIRLAAALEAHSNHPVARAIAALEEAVDLPAVTGFIEHPGCGLEGTIDGKNVLIGRASWVTSKGIDQAETTALPGSLVQLAIDGEHAATFHFSQSIRPEAAETLRRLREWGINDIRVISGDREEVVAAITARLGITDYLADCLPEDKIREVRRLRAEGRHVMMVGDGLNDAPALAESDLGVAIAMSGNDITVLTSDVALTSNDLRRIPDLLELSVRTVAIVNQNLLCGMLFIAAAIVLSSGGFIPPVAAAFFHELSAFFVIFNGARLLRFRVAEESGTASPELVKSTI